MPDDQQISQSVDNVIAQTPDDQSDLSGQPDASQSPFSLGSNPSANNTAVDNGPVNTVFQPSTAPADDGLVTVDQTDHSSAGDDDLGDIKQQALSQLTPIISELDQTPEEKYRTLMMLIQASDDKSLIKNAFEAANNIEDKKVKAEALLNIVNEINYFSSSSQPDEQPDSQEDL